MPLGIYSGVALTNASGTIEVADSASVEVRREDTGALASIFSGRNGSASEVLSNPMTADSNGRFEFYAAGIEEGYEITVTKGSETYTLSNQPVGTVQEKDASDVLGHHAGASEPSTTYAYQWWADTATGILKQRNAADDGWIDKGLLVGLGSGVLHRDANGVGTDADLLEKTLLSYSLPAGLLSTNGQSIRILAWGTTAANAQTKRLRVKFGSTTIFDSGALAANNQPWMLEYIITRTGPSAQDLLSKFGRYNATVINPGFSAVVAEDLTSAVTIAVTGQNGTATANNLVAQGWLIEYLN